MKDYPLYLRDLTMTLRQETEKQIRESGNKKLIAALKDEADIEIGAVYNLGCFKVR